MFILREFLFFSYFSRLFEIKIVYLQERFTFGLFLYFEDTNESFRRTMLMGDIFRVNFFFRQITILFNECDAS